MNQNTKELINFAVNTEPAVNPLVAVTTQFLQLDDMKPLEAIESDLFKGLEINPFFSKWELESIGSNKDLKVL